MDIQDNREEEVYRITQNDLDRWRRRVEEELSFGARSMRLPPQIVLQLLDAVEERDQLRKKLDVALASLSGSLQAPWRAL